MAIEVRCPNLDCRKGFKLRDSLAGKKVKCPACGTVIKVPDRQATPEPLHYHPARQICTNCGAVLGVRAVICPQCGGDVRTGITQLRITPEEKEEAGLAKALSAWKKKGKKSVPLVPLLIGVVVIVGLLIGAVLLLKGGKAGSKVAVGGKAEATQSVSADAETTETTTP